MAGLDAAVEAGVTFLDTADVYRDGRNETLIGRFLAQRSDAAEYLTVATKMGRRADPHVPPVYTLAAVRDWTGRSRRKLGADTHWMWCNCTVPRPRSLPRTPCSTLSTPSSTKPESREPVPWGGAASSRSRVVESRPSLDG